MLTNPKPKFEWDPQDLDHTPTYSLDAAQLEGMTRTGC